jgi:ABC-type iron transport system FetAB permease component
LSPTVLRASETPLRTRPTAELALSATRSTALCAERAMRSTMGPLTDDGTVLGLSSLPREEEVPVDGFMRFPWW